MWLRRCTWSKRVSPIELVSYGQRRAPSSACQRMLILEHDLRQALGMARQQQRRQARRVSLAHRMPFQGNLLSFSPLSSRGWRWAEPCLVLYVGCARRGAGQGLRCHRGPANVRGWFLEQSQRQRVTETAMISRSAMP